MIGIYKITNPKGKIYIGQSTDIEYRFYGYKKIIRCKSQKKLYNSLIKYGVENHTFSIIEECDVEVMNERERYWQDYFDVIKKGLNLKLTRYDDKIVSLSDETKEKIKLSMIGRTITWGDKISKKLKGKPNLKNRGRGNKPIIQFDKKNNQIKEWNSISEASKETKISFNSISNNLVGRCKSTGGFIWKYKV